MEFRFRAKSGNKTFDEPSYIYIWGFCFSTLASWSAFKMRRNGRIYGENCLPVLDVLKCVQFFFSSNEVSSWNCWNDTANQMGATSGQSASLRGNEMNIPIFFVLFCIFFLWHQSWSWKIFRAKPSSFLSIAVGMRIQSRNPYVVRFTNLVQPNETRNPGSLVKVSQAPWNPFEG